MVRFQPYHSIGADVANRIESKENLKDWLDYELLFYGAGKTAGLKRILGLGERALLGKHQRLLRIYEYHLNMGHRIRGGGGTSALSAFPEQICPAYTSQLLWKGPQGHAFGACSD